MKILVVILVVTVVVVLWWRFRLARPTIPPLSIPHDDPLMVEAIARAQGSIPRFQELLDEPYKAAHVKAPLVTESGQVEHLWAELLERHGDQLKVRLITPPVTHTGPLERLHTLSTGQLTDWQVELPSGQFVGGYTMKVMFTRGREQWGKLPPELLELERRYGDA